MLYEPVGYIVEYEISALIFLIVIMRRFFGARRFPNQKNRLFALILWVTLTDMVLDVVSSYIIDNVFLFPVAVTYTVNTFFYLLQVLLPLLMTAYTLAMVEKLEWHYLRRVFPLLLPGALTILLLLSTPLTHWFFYVDPQRGYVHGELFIYTYAACLFYMLVTFGLTMENRAKLRRSEYMTIFRFLVIVLISMAIQFFIPALLISGVAVALAVILMYFTIQNPDTMFDATTGAFTAEAMLQFLHDRMRERQGVQMVAVKINNMSRVNELLGMENGSLLLRMVSEFLGSGVEDSWVFRMRGGCFVAITRCREDFNALKKCADERISLPWRVGSAEMLLYATVCYVAADELLVEPISPEQAVDYLETAFLQNERSSSRVRTVTLGPEFLQKIKRRHAVELALREAIETGVGLEPYFQPLLSVEKGQFTNAEVLLRFRHPQMGFISPDEFVPIAESCGLVTAMDELVVRKTCAFIRDNVCGKELGLEAVEINLSALEFMHSRLPELLNGIMSDYGVDPSFICFEITETAATESFELLQSCMKELVACGCKFALDDFGTGYANVTQVISLPFSMVKLDRSLLLGSELVLEDMARMFNRMGIRTVIEGVETQEQSERCKAMRADYIQGFFYARPMDAAAFVSFLRDSRELT